MIRSVLHLFFNLLIYLWSFKLLNKLFWCFINEPLIVLLQHCFMLIRVSPGSIYFFATSFAKTIFFSTLNCFSPTYINRFLFRTCFPSYLQTNPVCSIVVSFITIMIILHIYFIIYIVIHEYWFITNISCNFLTIL